MKLQELKKKILFEEISLLGKSISYYREFSFFSSSSLTVRSTTCSSW